MPPPKLALFDLDHTLLSGDSDQLWCEFLIARGELGVGFRLRNAELSRRYAEGSVGPAEFSTFYAGTLAGRSPQAWQALRQAFARCELRPRLPPATHELLARHRAAGDRLLLTSATNRFLVEPSAALMGFSADELLATELEVGADGAFTGATRGTPNMREGKVTRLREWLLAQDLAPEAALSGATFYSDSINDLPLLEAVGCPVAVDPDPLLARAAAARGWPVLRLQR